VPVDFADGRAASSLIKGGVSGLDKIYGGSEEGERVTRAVEEGRFLQEYKLFSLFRCFYREKIGAARPHLQIQRMKKRMTLIGDD
jgi:hypothetical protein